VTVQYNKNIIMKGVCFGFWPLKNQVWGFLLVRGSSETKEQHLRPNGEKIQLWHGKQIEVEIKEWGVEEVKGTDTANEHHMITCNVWFLTDAEGSTVPTLKSEKRREFGCRKGKRSKKTVKCSLLD